MNMSYYRFACILPVAEKGDHDNVQGYPIITLAQSPAKAERLAIDAGMIYIGQLDTNGKIIPHESGPRPQGQSVG